MFTDIPNAMEIIRSSELPALLGCTHSILFLFSLTRCVFLQVAFSFHLFLLCISYWYTLEACAVWAVSLQSVDAALGLLGGLLAAPLLFRGLVHVVALLLDCSPKSVLWPAHHAGRKYLVPFLSVQKASVSSLLFPLGYWILSYIWLCFLF